MTYRRITSLVSLFIGLLVALHSPIVSAADAMGGASAPFTISGGTTCLESALDRCDMVQAGDSTATLLVTATPRRTSDCHAREDGICWRMSAAGEE
jgi:hypothetical protein